MFSSSQKTAVLAAVTILGHLAFVVLLGIALAMLIWVGSHESIAGLVALALAVFIFLGLVTVWRSRALSEQMALQNKLREQEASLLKSLEWQEALFEGSRDAILIADTDSRFVAVNQAACDLTGYSRDELLRMRIPDLHAPEDLGAYHEFHARIMAGEEIVSEAKIRRKDQTKVETEFNNRRIVAVGTPYMHTVARDVTRRKREAAEIERLYQSAQQSVERHAVLYRASQEIVAAGLDPERVYGAIHQAMGRLMPTEVVVISILDPSGGSMRTVYAFDRGQRLDWSDPFPVETSLSGYVIRAGKPVVVDDLEQVADTVPHMHFTSEHVRAILAVPLKVGTKLLGVLSTQSYQPRVYTREHTELLEMLAAHAGAAIENAGLHAETERHASRLAALAQAGRAMTATLDRREVLLVVSQTVQSMLEADGSVVMLIDSSKGVLVCAEAHGPNSEKLVGLRMPASGSICGRAFQTRQAVVIADVTGDRHFYSKADDTVGGRTRSLLAAPMIVKGDAVGVLAAVHGQVGAFDSQDAEMIEALASTAASAIENARLYQAERDQHRQLQDSQAKLIQAEKMAALGRLVASVAHEINNPLQIMTGSLELLSEGLDGGARPDKTRRYLQVIEKEVDRVAAIVQRLRDFYRPARREMQLVDLDQILSEVLALSNKQLLHANVVVERRVLEANKDQPPLVRANPDHLKQVFLNLVLNAVDAMHEGGGTLSVQTGLASIPAPQFLSAEPAILPGVASLAPTSSSGPEDQVQRPAVCVEFADTGLGMPPEILSKLFEPFFTTKSGGTGLGLAISYEIIQAHDGQILVSSQPGVGTTFTIVLPVAGA